MLQLSSRKPPSAPTRSSQYTLRHIAYRLNPLYPRLLVKIQRCMRLWLLEERFA
jgi:hypothetical protein